MATEMINRNKSGDEYIKPSCSVLSIEEETMIAASPEPTPDSPPHLDPPKDEQDEVTDPSYAKQHHYYEVWEQW